MLSAQCQSDEDWHAGKLSFISLSASERRAAALRRPFSPLPPLITKARTLFIQAERGRDRQGERERGETE